MNAAPKRSSPQATLAVTGPFEKTKGLASIGTRGRASRALRFLPEPSTRIAMCSGLVAEFPYAPERKYTPCDAGKAQLFALRDRLGFDRKCHRAGDLSRLADNSAMVDALLSERRQSARDRDRQARRDRTRS